MTRLHRLGTIEGALDPQTMDALKSISKHPTAMFIQEEFAFAMKTTAIPRLKETCFNPVINPILNFQNYINIDTN